MHRANEGIGVNIGRRWPSRQSRPWFCLIVGMMVLVPQLVHAQALGSASFVLDNVRAIIGDGSVVEGASISVEDGQIVSVLPRADSEHLSGLTVIDLTGKTVMPALIDAHAHLGYEGHTSWGGDNYTRENLIDHLERYAYYGFSAVFSAGSDPDRLAFDVQQAGQRNEFLGARFLFAAGVAPPGQGPNDRFLRHALELEQSTGQDILYGVSDPRQARETVRRIAEKKIPVIKIWVDDRGGSQQKLSPEVYRAITAEAQAQNIAVYAHQQFASDMPGLIDAGVAGFLHGRIGSGLGSEIAEQLAAADTFVVPNLGLAELRREAIGLDPFLQSSLPASVLPRLSPSAQRLAEPNRAQEAEIAAMQSFASLLDAGVDILLGTDAGAVPDHFFGYTGHRELEIFVRLGMTTMQAIVAGTSKPAQMLGLEDLGQLQPGYSADLIVLDENPLQDIRNTRSIWGVYLGGRLVDRDSLAQRFEGLPD